LFYFVLRWWVISLRGYRPPSSLSYFVLGWWVISPRGVARPVVCLILS